MNDFDKHPVNTPNTSRHDKNMAMLSHILPLFFFIIPGLNIALPLIFWFLTRHKSSYIEHHARESLNFQITISLATVLWIVLKLMLVGILLLPLVPVIIIIVFIFMIRAAMKASSGSLYNYPMTIRFVS